MLGTEKGLAVAPAQSYEKIDAKQHTKATQLWHRIALAVVLSIAAFCELFLLTNNGLSNLYYATAIKSMLTSWHNFFFLSFDPGGFIAVDKPPLGLWIQAASAWLFGFNSLSLLVPQVLASLLSVALLYYLVRRVFGPEAGLIAALALALMPISVVTARTNLIDSLLTLDLLLAAWAVSRATETGQLRWWLLCALILGLGFNIKMLQAYLVIPAFVLMYLLGAPLSWRRRIAQLALATLVLLVVSFSWIAAVDLTPASQRPYVGSSYTNSELSLAIGYNGIGRLIGLFKGSNASSGGGANVASAAFTGVSANETGTPGPLRLFQEPLGGEASWLLPFALLGLLAAARKRKPRFRGQPKQQALVLWGTWLLVTGLFFSVAGFIHSYYLVVLAPALCALVGIGAVAMWEAYRREGARGWLLPIALLLTAALQVILLVPFPAWSWLAWPLVGLCSLKAIALIALRLDVHFPLPSLSDGAKRIMTIVTSIVALLTLLIAPAVWIGMSLGQPTSGTIPTAGPVQVSNPFASAIPTSGPSAAVWQTLQSNLWPGFIPTDPVLERYLQDNQGSASYLALTFNAMTAAPLILDTAKPVIALGGFNGSDGVVTTRQVIALVDSGRVRFFLLPILPSPSQLATILPGAKPGQKSSGTNGFAQNFQTVEWATTHCTALPTQLWNSVSAISSTQQLYDCANHS